MGLSALAAIAGVFALAFSSPVKGEGRFEVLAPAPSGKQRPCVFRWLYYLP